MKRIILFICTLFFVQTLSAQVSSDILYRNTNTNVRLAIKDAKTAEPISWASVYLGLLATPSSLILHCQMRKVMFC